MRKWIADVCMFLLALVLMMSSGATLCYQIAGSSEPIDKIKELQSENRRDEALDLVQFYENNKFVDARKLKELKASLEYTRVEKCQSIVKGAVTGSVYDSYSGIGAIVSDLCIYGDIRDLGIQTWTFLKNEKTDAIVAVLSGIGIFLSVQPYADVSVTFAKTSVKYLRRISGFTGNNSILAKLLKGTSLSFKESKLILSLLKKTNGQSPAPQQFWPILPV